jgi:hypothetical protein
MVILYAHHIREFCAITVKQRYVIVFSRSFRSYPIAFPERSLFPSVPLRFRIIIASLLIFSYQQIQSMELLFPLISAASPCFPSRCLHQMELGVHGLFQIHQLSLLESLRYLKTPSAIIDSHLLLVSCLSDKRKLEHAPVAAAPPSPPARGIRITLWVHFPLLSYSQSLNSARY